MRIEKEFLRAAERIFKRAKKEGRLISNPLLEELREMLKKENGVKKTIYGNYVVETEPTSRATRFTKNSIDHQFGPEEEKLIAKCEETLSRERLISIDRRVGESRRTVRLIVPEKYAHLAYALTCLQLPAIGKVVRPNYYILIFTDEAFMKNTLKPLPEKDITIRIAFLDKERGVKIVRNSTYFGEVKKGIFAFEDWLAKERGGIFLHAACREDYLQQEDGSYKNVVSLIVALSGNGKTTLSCKILARKEGEKSWLVQDDGGCLYPSGLFEGFEGGGLYVKTEKVHPGEQLEIYYGLLKPTTLLENVYLEDGDFDFFNLTKTANGRAVVQRSDFMHASNYIKVPKIDNLFLVTRGPLFPAISKLTLEQAGALMVIGMAMETSAGDPTQAGRIRSEFFYDPFVAGDRAEHANRFYKICQGLPNLSFYLLNTGGIGPQDHYQDITVSQTVSILDSLFRGGLKKSEDWIESPLGFKVPVAVRGVDPIYFHPEKLYLRERFEEEKRKLFQYYRGILQKYKGLGSKIIEVF